MKICILCNGPGELWGWARPVVRELKSRGHDVTLWLLRCPYASGREAQVAESFNCRVIPPTGILSFFTKLRNGRNEKFDVALQLGGDIFWGRKLAAPLFCYTYGRKNGLAKASAVFTAFDGMAKNIKNSIVIGDLVKDAMALDCEKSGEEVWRDDYGGRKIIFLPGSRKEIRKKSLFLVRDIVQELKKFHGFENFEPAVLFSPFADEEEFCEWKKAGLNPTRAGAGAALKEAEYVVTQPGTNTLEIMHSQTNGLVIAPLSFLSEIPISGIGGIIANIPFIGKKIKEFVLRRKVKKLSGYVSLPNRIAEQPLLAEMVGYFGAADVARKIVSELANEENLNFVKKTFSEISATSDNATKKLCDFICGIPQLLYNYAK